MTRDFFEIPKDHSRVKAELVSQYVGVWANIIHQTLRRKGDLDTPIGYFDAYAGGGEYDDGSASTPILVIRELAKRPEVAGRVIMHFNDGDEGRIERLVEAVSKEPSLRLFHSPPSFSHRDVDEEYAESIGLSGEIPKFFFVDPFGYKGLTQELIDRALESPQSDVIFFFNYSRINAATNNPVVQKHVEQLFGKDRTPAVKERLSSCKDSYEREEVILEEFVRELESNRANYTHLFRFPRIDQKRTSHYLVFATKHPLGYNKFKETAAKFCGEDQGVPTYTFDPNPEYRLQLERPLDDLKSSLIKEFQGQLTTIDKIFSSHSLRTPYIRKNYTAALRQLEKEGHVRIDRPVSTKSNTVGQKAIIRFIDK